MFRPSSAVPLGPNTSPADFELRKRRRVPTTTFFVFSKLNVAFEDHRPPRGGTSSRARHASPSPAGSSSLSARHARRVRRPFRRADSNASSSSVLPRRNRQHHHQRDDVRAHERHRDGLLRHRHGGARLVPHLASGALRDASRDARAPPPRPRPSRRAAPPALASPSFQNPLDASTLRRHARRGVARVPSLPTTLTPPLPRPPPQAMIDGDGDDPARAAVANGEIGRAHV